MLSDAVAEILVVVKAYDWAFLSEYILRATQTTDEVQSFGPEARELAGSYAATFAAGDGGATDDVEEETESP